MARNQLVEALRILSCLGIVWFHTGVPGSEIAYAGLSAFIMITMQFDVGENWHRKLGLKKRAWRLLWPWAVWFAIFSILNIIKHKPAIPLEHGLISGILYGSQGYLWYLPFMFGILSLTSIAKARLSQSKIFYISAILAALCLAGAAFWRPWSLKEGFPIAQYLQAMPAVFLGMMIGTRKTIRFGMPVVLGIIAAYGAFGAYWLLTENFTGVAIPHFIAGALAVAAVEFGENQSIKNLKIQALANCTYGIYLTQFFWISAAKRLEPVSIFLWPIGAFLLGAVTVYAYQLCINMLAHSHAVQLIAARFRRTSRSNVANP